MSIGKNSIVRAANAAAKADAAAEADALEAMKETAPAEQEALAVKAKPCEKFKKVSVGDKMPPFLL